ncbi:MAG: acetyl/propionyl-CoA carboxylase subunit alpha [Acidobacteria bacterium]|nr:acetyl/propionyl-CoA carboxylase subunit alpha [Acidobacteriota bacterium]
MLRRVLIANRGEIAVRIIRTCRALGIETVAVCSDADRNARHVGAADRAVTIGPAPAGASYLSVERIIDAARASGADAIHPGYGFLSERPELASACSDAGLVWVGPPAGVVARFGSKIEARQAAEQAGVPVVPGSAPDDQTPAGITAAARAVGVPVLLKPSAGGGGKGMVVVDAADQLAESIARARREAVATTGDGTLYVERRLERPRHVEVQIVADRGGRVVTLGERDCSLQRRHQKVIEETPAPGLTDSLRRRLAAAAADLARHARYENAGTVEFLVERGGSEDADGRCYFLEMNTRLQVEHPVTEMVAGIDLVAAQLAIAAGDALPWSASEVAPRGHAMECRIYAEDPARGFLPQAGRIDRYMEPSGPGVRVDSGVGAGSDVPVHYDPLLAKLITAGRTRDEARRRAQAALGEFVLTGITTNIPFLRAALAHPAFEAGDVQTSFLQDHAEALATAAAELAGEADKVETLAERERAADRATGPRGGEDVWRRLAGWRLGGGGTGGSSGVAGAGGGAGRVGPPPADALDGTSGDSAPRPDEDALCAPMPATVTAVAIAPGDTVTAGDALIRLEAMKMELAIRAPTGGHVTAVHCAVGDLVQPGRPLVTLDQVE